MPAAYLNYLLFDKDYNFITGGFEQVTSAGDFTQELVSFSQPIVVTEAGYLFVYLSNESNTTNWVYFDDLKITHSKSPVIQSDDYYPFGLAFNLYQRENATPNRWKFQGQEHIDDLDLGWVSFKWRNHDPSTGRFFNVDPLASKYVYNSPYAFSENSVIAFRELEGLEKVWATFQIGDSKPEESISNTADQWLNFTVDFDSEEVVVKQAGDWSKNFLHEFKDHMVRGDLLDVEYKLKLIVDKLENGSKVFTITGSLGETAFIFPSSAYGSFVVTGTIVDNKVEFNTTFFDIDKDKMAVLRMGSDVYENRYCEWCTDIVLGTKPSGEESSNTTTMEFYFDESSEEEVNRVLWREFKRIVNPEK